MSLPRYDHFAVLCELLPTGIPSMAVDLLTTSYGYFNSSLQSEFYKALECIGTSRTLEEPIDLNNDPKLFDKMSWCYFPGASVFKMTRSLEMTQREVAEFLAKAQGHEGWLTDYNHHRNFSSPYRVDEVMQGWAMMANSVSNLIRSAKPALEEMFDEFTVAEWIEQKILPMYQVS